MEVELKEADDVIYDIQQSLLGASEEFIAEIANKVCSLNYAWDYPKKKFVVTDTFVYSQQKRELLLLAQEIGLVSKDIDQEEFDDQMQGLWNDFITSEFYDDYDNDHVKSMTDFINDKMPPEA